MVAKPAKTFKVGISQPRYFNCSKTSSKIANKSCKDELSEVSRAEICNYRLINSDLYL